MEKTNGRAGQRGKSIEEVVSYSLGHRIRIEVLAILHEGTYSPNELARKIGEPLGKVTHHVNELLDAGAIELARTEPVRNATQHFYRAIELPDCSRQGSTTPVTAGVSPRFYTDEEFAAMPVQQRQLTAGLVLQAAIAESLAALWAGKMAKDPRIWMSWRWFNVDAHGRADIADEQARFWERVQEIEVESDTRRAETSEEAVSVMVTSLGFERSRTSPPPPPVSANAD